MKPALSYFGPLAIAWFSATARVFIDLLAYCFVKPSVTHSSGLVLVTGASRGLGRAIAEVLSQAGFTVIAGVRKEADGAKLLSEVPSVKHFIILDVGDAASVAASTEAVTKISTDTGLQLVALVNNAGFLCIQALELTSEETFDSVMNVNVGGVFRMVQAHLPALRASKGRIVNISSIGADFPLGLTTAYQSSKAALNQLSNVLRLELFKQDISVSVVSPGAIATEMISQSNLQPPAVREGVSVEAKEVYAKQYKLVEGTRNPYEAPPLDIARVAVLHAVSSPRPYTTYYWGYDAVFFKGLLALLPQSLIAKLASLMA